jgi:hypothetical protein
MPQSVGRISCQSFARRKAELQRSNIPRAQERDSLIKPKEKPDRYAAAICIMVRPDCLLRGYSVGESCGLSGLQRA